MGPKQLHGQLGILVSTHMLDDLFAIGSRRDASVACYAQFSRSGDYCYGINFKETGLIVADLLDVIVLYVKPKHHHESDHEYIYFL